MTGPRADNVQPIPEGYRAVTAWIISRDSARLIEFLGAAFGAVFLAAPPFQPRLLERREQRVAFGHDLCAWSGRMAETVQSANGEERAMAPRVEKVGLGYKVSKGMPWLDSIAATMEQAFRPVLGQDAPRGPRDFLYGTWLGHSLHAAVITMPVGSWSAAMIFDVMGEERAADLSLGLGLVGAAGAAVTGAAQWQDTTNEEAPRRLGTLHALLNVAATSLMAGSWLMRQQGRRGSGVTLSTLGLGINLASAWLGGELAYELGIGVNHAAFQTSPHDWTDVAALDDLADGKPHRVEADGTPVLLLQQGNRIRAIG